MALTFRYVVWLVPDVAATVGFYDKAITNHPLHEIEKLLAP